jgi:pimeloyl-ACP methyl ester carboxylesterase
MWLAAQHPDRVKSLSLHSSWPATDRFLRDVVEGWRVMAKALDSVTDMAIQGILPWCFTPEFYSARPDYIDSLAEFVRGRPMPPVDAFLRQSGAVLNHDARQVLGSVRAPTLLTFGRHDMVTSTRFVGPISDAIADTELVVFEDCAHAPIYQDVEQFNSRTLDFLQRHSG